MPGSAFFEVHRDLVREGPGLPEDVHWALDRLDLSGAIRVCDAGCGPGADSVTLAKALPEARIDAVDGQAHFIEAARARTARFRARVAPRVGDMAAIEGPYDLIWCAGALYFLGVTEGLTTWRTALAPGGKVAFSEPCVLSHPPSDAVQAFWAGEGAVGDLEDICRRVTDAGYRVIDTRMIVGAAWEVYYTSMQERIDTLLADGRGEALAGAIADAQTEIAQWRAAPDEIAYALVLAEPV